MSDARALLAYYRDCVQAERRTDVVYDARHPAIALLTEGREPAVSRGDGSDRSDVCPVPIPEPAAAWVSAQLTSARSEPVSCGYPLAVARRGGRLVVAPLLSRECQFERRSTGLHLSAVDAPVETGEHALALLGWDPAERTSWLEADARAPSFSYDDVIRRAARAGITVTHLDPRRLSPLPQPGSRPTLANTAMLFMPQPVNAARGVIAELDELTGARASRLRRGPLGIMLGNTRHRSHPIPERPLPVVVSSNLPQDHALQSAQRNALTVVTGPPGTGKSQLLVNAVATTMQRGETVLFTSRTNRAVDVVFERLQELPGGVPLRAGRAALRVQAADVIRRALERRPDEPGNAPTRDEARPAWPALARRLEPLGELAAERRRAQESWLEAFATADRMSASARWELATAAAGPAAAAARDQAARRLALFPPEEVLRARLAGYQEARVAAGRELWQLSWARLAGGSPRRVRAGAAALARHLELGRPARAAADYRLGLQAFPVWGLTNLAAASCLPLTAGLFDLVIVDEASQCDIGSALPLLARARRALIIGDPQQLSHVSRLSLAREEAIARQHGIGSDVLGPMSQRQRSLYDAAAARSDRAPLLLDEHYRCHPRVIAFSNDRLYASRLTIRTSPVDGGGIMWRDVAGSFRRGPSGRSVCNIEEAAAVVQQLDAEQCANRSATIGVVAPFRAQVELIRRLATTSDACTIDTVHRFQGDERDVMLLSPTVAAAMPRFFRGVAGEPRLLNVAVTRARHRLVVVGDREACLATGGLLAELAAYATPLAAPNGAPPITEAPGPGSLDGDRHRRRQAPGRPS